MSERLDVPGGTTAVPQKTSLKHLLMSSIKASLKVVVAVLLAVSLSVVNTPAEENEPPLSSFNMGFAKKAEGRTVVVSFFVDTPETRYTMKEMKRDLTKLKAACEYICQSSEEYGVKNEFVYDWSRDSFLYHRGLIDFEPDDSEESFEALDKYIQRWVSYEPGFEGILEKYDADNVFIVVNFNTSGRDYSVVFDGEDIPEESLVTYSSSSACTLAHEILHLFGAHDFYFGAEYSDEVVGYIKKTYPNDIMLAVDSAGRIRKSIGKLTAYHLGWADEPEDVKRYPELRA